MENLTLASIKMSNSPGSARPPPLPWGLTLIGALFNLGLLRFQCIMNKTLLLPFLKAYIGHLFDNLESGKRNYCFG